MMVAEMNDHLAGRVSSALPQPKRSFDPIDDLGPCRKKLLQIIVIKIRIRNFVELALPRVVRLELDVQAIVVGGTIRRLMKRWLAGE